MMNEMTIERKSNLVLPSQYVELDREEMAYIEGGDYVISSKTCSNILCGLMGAGWFAFVGYSLTCAAVGASTVIGGIVALIAAIPFLLPVAIYAAAHAIVFAGYLVGAAVSGKDLHIGTILGFIPNPRDLRLE